LLDLRRLHDNASPEKSDDSDDDDSENDKVDIDQDDMENNVEKPFLSMLFSF